MTTKGDAVEAARRSYELRQRRCQQSEERLAAATAELKQLFDHAFVHPDAAAAKFAQMVEHAGLKRAAARMQSAPTDITPAWKTLQGEIHPFSGVSRQRERAMELVAELPTLYRKAEAARQAHDLALDLRDQALEHLQSQLGAAPRLKTLPAGGVQRRKLGQRQRL